MVVLRYLALMLTLQVLMVLLQAKRSRRLDPDRVKVTQATILPRGVASEHSAFTPAP